MTGLKILLSIFYFLMYNTNDAQKLFSAQKARAVGF